MKDIYCQLILKGKTFAFEIFSLWTRNAAYQFGWKISRNFKCLGTLIISAYLTLQPIKCQKLAFSRDETPAMTL